MAPCLHGSQQSRSPLVNWYCHEAGIPLTMKAPRPSPHPFGQVPCLTDDGGVEVFESGAILLYLADKYGDGSTPEKRAQYTKWVVWANAELDNLCFGQKMSGTMLDQPEKKLDVLEEMLGQRRFMLGDQFTVADVAVAAYLNYVPVFFPRVRLVRPNLTAYMERCAMRDAFAKAFGAEHTQAVLQKCEQALYQGKQRPSGAGVNAKAVGA
jgi:glutathione S-transferase/alpha,alpha-trehalase